MPTNPIHPRQLLADLAATPSRLSEVVDDLSNYERYWRPGPGKWSCTEIAGHLADAELVFGCRIRTALAEPGKAMGSFDQDAWAAAGRWNELPAEVPLRSFTTSRQGMVALLELADDEAWGRTYLHSARGPQSVADTVRLLVSHDARHLVQLGRVAEEAREAAKRGTRGIAR